jgi:phage tail sheath protein FI
MSNDVQWRYLNVRRLVTQIERSVTAYAGWLVFEPDNQSLRDDAERVIRQYLDQIWRAGGLDGGTADDAYTVHIEDAEVAATSGDARLIVELGVQPPWPAEFVVVRIDLSEPGRGDRAGGGVARGSNS